MKLEDIYQFFAKEQVIFLSSEQAVCYILSVLLKKESYGTQLIQKLENEHPYYRLSDTVLYVALKFLENEGAIAAYWKKVESRGRPRHMYQLTPEWQDEAQKLAHLWTANAVRERAEKPVLTKTGIGGTQQVAAY
jgi:DNA-binding PadR family transcriptional regulator